MVVVVVVAGVLTIPTIGVLKGTIVTVSLMTKVLRTSKSPRYNSPELYLFVFPVLFFRTY